MGPRMLWVLQVGASLALPEHGLGIAGWGLVFLLAVVVSTFFGGGVGELQAINCVGDGVLSSGSQVSLCSFDYRERHPIGIRVKWS